MCQYSVEKRGVWQALNRKMVDLWRYSLENGNIADPGVESFNIKKA